MINRHLARIYNLTIENINFSLNFIREKKYKFLPMIINVSVKIFKY